MSSPFSIQCGSLVLLLPVTACLRAAPTTGRAGRPSRVGRSDRPRPPSSIERRLGARIQPFGACSGFTRVAAVRSLTRSKRISVPEASTGRSPSLSLGSYQGVPTPPWTGLVRAETLSPAVRHLRIARVENGRPLCESMSVSLSRRSATGSMRVSELVHCALEREMVERLLMTRPENRQSCLRKIAAGWAVCEGS